MADTLRMPPYPQHTAHFLYAKAEALTPVSYCRTKFMKSQRTLSIYENNIFVFFRANSKSLPREIKEASDERILITQYLEYLEF